MLAADRLACLVARVGRRETCVVSAAAVPRSPRPVFGPGAAHQVGQYYCPKYHAKILPRKQGFATAKNALCRHLGARRRIAANNSVKAKSNKSKPSQTKM